MSSQHIAPDSVIADRRERFRTFMRKFNPTAPAHLAIRDDLVVEDPARSVYKKIAARIDLEAGSQQLLVGGIGSGKTTELLLLSSWVSTQGKARPLFIDVTELTDVSDLQAGALLATLVRHIPQHLKELARQSGKTFERGSGFAAALEELEGFAYGKTKKLGEALRTLRLPVFGINPNDVIHVPGKLTPPRPLLQSDIRDALDPLKALLAGYQGLGADCVVVFDGLDRLMESERFRAVTDQDLRAMRVLGVSVVLAAPLSLLYGEARAMSEHFDKVYTLPAAIADPKRSPFLTQIVEKRGGRDLLGPEAAETVCLGSGGVLRDLIALVRNAAEEAYIDGAEAIQRVHVQTAIRQLGQSYLIGLGRDQIETLMMARDKGKFTPNTASNLELLLTRRVLDRPPPDPFEVHPALAPLLEAALDPR
jgi:hypothetical protein